MQSLPENSQLIRKNICGFPSAVVPVRDTRLPKTAEVGGDMGCGFLVGVTDSYFIWDGIIGEDCFGRRYSTGVRWVDRQTSVFTVVSE